MSDSIIVCEFKEISTFTKRNELYYRCFVNNKLYPKNEANFLDIDERTMRAVMKYFDMPNEDPQLLIDRKKRFAGIDVFSTQAFNRVIARALNISTRIVRRQDVADRLATIFSTINLNELKNSPGFDLDLIFHCLYEVFQDPRTIDFFIYDFSCAISILTCGKRSIRLADIESGNDMNMAIFFSMHDTAYRHIIRYFRMNYMAFLTEITL